MRRIFIIVLTALLVFGCSPVNNSIQPVNQSDAKVYAKPETYNISQYQNKTQHKALSIARSNSVFAANSIAPKLTWRARPYTYPGSIFKPKTAVLQTYPIAVGPLLGNQELSKLTAPNSMFEFQDSSDPEIDWLAGNHVYPWLEQKLGPNWRDETQWEQIIEVRKWAHQKMTAYGGQAGEPSPYVTDKRGYPYGMKDPIYPRYIIEWAEAGGRAECSNWNRLFMAGLHTIGVRSRLISVVHYNNGDPQSDTSIEVYSTDYHKWVLMHAEFNSYVHLGDKIPLSATEIYYAARQGKLDLIQYEQDPPTYSKETGKEEILSVPDPYLNWHREQGYSRDWEWKSFFKNIVVFQSDKVFEIPGDWIGKTMEKTQVIYDPAYAEESFPETGRETDHSKINWSVNELHVDVTKVTKNIILLEIHNNVQEFGGYKIRVDRTTGTGRWRKLPEPYVMKLDNNVTQVLVGAVDTRGVLANYVKIPIISRIEVFPEPASEASEFGHLSEIKFVAKGYDANGKEISTVTPVWSTDNGAIASDGTFTPSKAEVATITANYEGITDYMTVQLNKSQDLVRQTEFRDSNG